MKNYYFLLFIIIFFVNIAEAQKSEWISLEQTGLFNQKPSSGQSSLVEKEIPTELQKNIPIGIAHVKLSCMVFSFAMKDYMLYLNGIVDSTKFFGVNYDTGSYTKKDHKWKIYGLRGTKNNKEVFFLDANMNMDFSDDDIHDLPIPKFIQGMPRMVKMFYPADTSFYYDIEYEFVENDLIQKRKAKIAAQIFSQYPTLNDSLKCEDGFRIAFRENLSAHYPFGDSLFSLDIRDRLPWENKYVNIHILSPSGIKKTIKLKDKFQINQGNFYHSFDSLDVLYKKILISTHEKPDTFKLVANAFDYANSSIDYKDLPKAKGYRLVHFWGPWCAPCIQNMPKIKDFQHSFKTIEFMGVCADKDKSKCISSIEKLGITWQNIFVDLLNFDKTDQMNITNWPTYFIVDSDDVVKLRTSEIEELGRFLKNN